LFQHQQPRYLGSHLQSPVDAQVAQAYGATFLSPDRLFQLQIFMIGFDDDSNACVNDLLNPDQSPEVIFERATTDAQLWNDLLCCSGGALEIPEWRITSLTMGFCCRGSGTSNSPIVISLRFGFKKDQKSLRHPSSIYPLCCPQNAGMLQITLRQLQKEHSTYRSDS
jgi:hypothetical protein